MRFSQFLSSARPAAVAIVAMLALAGCSNGPSLSGPSWNLTGSRMSVSTPPKVMSQPASADANAPQPVYRGGRDPVTGRASADGAPAQPLASLASPPTTVAAATPPPAGPPAAPPPRSVAAPAAVQASVPQAAPVPAVAPPPTQAPPVAVSAPSAVPSGQRPQVVEVQQGDSLAKLASQYKVSIASLMQANKLRDPYISPGQWLVLPKR